MTGRLLSTQERFEGKPLASHQGGRPLQPLCLSSDAQPEVGSVRIIAPDLVAERTRDGDNYIRICARHQWAGMETYSIDATAHTQCPSCAVELDRDHGQFRYRLLHMRLSLKA